jgi:putative SOS response-associated peptidase YedK
LIPISGYYEWQNTEEGKQPLYFTARDGSPLLTAAGLWDEWKDRHDHHGAERICCRSPRPDASAAIGKAVRAVAERGGGAQVLKPAPNDCLQRWPVSKRVNSSKVDADDATLIDRVEPIGAV